MLGGGGSWVGSSAADGSITRVKLATGAVGLESQPAAKTTTYTIDTADDLIRVDGTTAAFTVTLPTAVGVQGRRYTIIRTDQTLANIVTVATTSSQTFTGGSTTKKLVTQGETLEVESDGANWLITRRFIPADEYTYTPTGLWISGATFSGYWSRLGNKLVGRVQIAVTGTPSTASCTIALPTGLTFDATKLLTTDQFYSEIFSKGASKDGVTGRPLYLAWYSTTTMVAIYMNGGTGTGSVVNATAPATWANGDKLWFDFVVPITNWEG